jgi:serine/threonine-protein kinase
MERIADRYEVHGELGQGGTATVYRARDTVLGRDCAVKVLLDVGQGEAGQHRRQRLQTEAHALARLDHPRVVRVFDLGDHDGRPYLAMELLQGGSLADRLAQHGPLRPAEAVDRLLEVLEALEAAHHAGIVHRDVKPHNVLLRPDGTAALADFGIARQHDRALTRTGIALGSHDYMAPEQRVDARHAGPGADIYGAGCTLYHLLTGDTPVDLYLAPDHSPRFDGVPPPLRQVVRRATAVDPADRYPSAQAMASALGQVRGAVEQLPARQPVAALHGTPAHPPTRVEIVPTAERPGRAGPEEYAWATRPGPRAGRTAALAGVALVGAVVVAAVVAQPLLDAGAPGIQAHAEPVPFGVPTGRWQGPFDGRHMGTLTFDGPAELLSAELELQLDGHRMHDRLVGRFDPVEGVLDLRGARGGLVATADRRGVLTGDLQVGRAEPIPFVLVGALGE